MLIWILRGNSKAARVVDGADARYASVVTYMELLQGARDKREAKTIQSFLADVAFRIQPLTENIGHRASIYMEEHALKAGLCVADALIAATAVECHLTLCTGDRKHYRPIGDLDVKAFRP